MFLHKYSNLSQNAEDDWNGFAIAEKPPVEKQQDQPRPSRSSAAKVKAVDDFSGLDVKSKVSTAPKMKDDKEADLWDMLNS